jgi:hypothetical protein
VSIEEISYQDFSEVFVGLLSCLENSVGIVDATRVTLQPKKNFFRRGGAVHTWADVSNR